MLKESVVIKRLAFIKYLYKVAVEQSQRPEPLCSASILSFHDAIELFLQLACEHLDVGKGKGEIRFLEYWGILPSKLPPGVPTHKESMEKLNRARVNLKHHGILPSKSQIEEFRAIATNFFEENSLRIFGIKFSEVSLIDLVQCQEAKNNLKEAMQLLEQNKIEESLDKVALAFTQLIDDYENRKRGQFGRSPFFIGEDLTFLGSSSITGTDKSRAGKLADFIDKVKESVEALQKAVKILSLGIDYRRYVRFRLLIPQIYRTLDGTYHIQRIQYGSKGIPSVEDVRFCIDFVIESSITLQEFDYSIEGYLQ
jgi:hypothetical protein